MNQIQDREMTISETGIYVKIKYSLMEKITRLLSIIIASNETKKFYFQQSVCSRNFKNKKEHEDFIIRVSNLKSMFCENIKKTSHMYLAENRKLIIYLYEFWYNISDWKDYFIMDYDIYYDYYERSIPLPEIDDILDDMHYITIQLAEIVLDYDKMKKDNMKFAEEIAKYVFNPKRMINICEKYGLEDIQLKTKLFEIEDYIHYLDLLS